jgi:hydrogenase/urease accessory protein HupE
MRNWKTSALGAITILIALLTGAKEYIATDNLPDVGLIIASIVAGWGLIVAKDNDARL